MKKFALLFVSLFAISALTNAQAVLRITEVMSSGGTADWIEISNIGNLTTDHFLSLHL
jgi:transcriptional regulator GlxA family with amidase domain